MGNIGHRYHVGDAGAMGELGLLGEVFHVVKIPAPEGGAVGFLQCGDVRRGLGEEAGKVIEVAADDGGALEHLVAAILAPVGDV